MLAIKIVIASIMYIALMVSIFIRVTLNFRSHDKKKKLALNDFLLFL